VVLRGEGTTAFGAGSDIREFTERRTGDAARAYNAVESAAAEAIESIPVPVLAAIHGPCMGGGIGLALCADIRYAADDARFAVTPAKLGVGYPADSMARLARTVGAPRARELVLTARTVDATEAVRIGLVHAVLPKSDLDAHVATVARDIAALAPLTLRAAKASLEDRADGAGGADTARRDALIAACYASADYAEGIRAYLEKRPPDFTGR
jgi:enoyl-CoA hydratase/carnithine racemase